MNLLHGTVTGNSYSALFYLYQTLILRQKQHSGSLYLSALGSVYTLLENTGPCNLEEASLVGYYVYWLVSNPGHYESVEVKFKAEGTLELCPT